MKYIVLGVLAGLVVLESAALIVQLRDAPVIAAPVTCVVELHTKPREVHEYHGRVKDTRV